MIKYNDGDSWKDAVLDYYPVGALYFSFSSTSPADLFGGSWSELTQAGYMIGVRGKASAGNTGGQKKLTVNNLPAHTHSILYGDNQGNNAGSGILSSVFSGSYGFYGYNPDFKTRLWTDDFALAGSTAGGGQIINTQLAADFFPAHYGTYIWERVA